MKEFTGVDIKEVWNHRLSTAVPTINRDGATWVVEIWSKSNPDYVPGNEKTLAKPLEVFDTGIKSEVGDHHDPAKIAKCYEWLYTKRDAYAHQNIEALKPIVASIEAKTADLLQLNAKYAEVQ
jgi:hypothetical protein